MYPILNIVIDNDNITLVMLNKSRLQEVYAPGMHPRMPSIPRTHAVVYTGATFVFVMKGTPMLNVRPVTQPLTINLLDWKIVTSTHVCGLIIPGLPTLLKGILEFMLVKSMFKLQSDFAVKDFFPQAT